MDIRAVIAAAAALAVGACDNSVKVTGSASDGETFKGVAIGTGFWDQSGTLQLVSNRGLNCVGTYVFEGLMGPKGKASLNCSDGSVAETTLDMTARTGAGTIGARTFRFTW